MGALKKVAGPPPKKPFKGAVELSWLERRLACTIGCLPTFRCLIYVILWCMFVVCMQIHLAVLASCSSVAKNSHHCPGGLYLITDHYHPALAAYCLCRCLNAQQCP